MRIFYWDGTKSFFVRIGPYACRYSFSRKGRFGNGSRWSSGWHNWKREAEQEQELYGP